jgi:hypothetical protein
MSSELWLISKKLKGRALRPPDLSANDIAIRLIGRNANQRPLPKELDYCVVLECEDVTRRAPGDQLLCNAIETDHNAAAR